MTYKILLSTTVEKTLPLGRALRDIGYEICVFDATIRSPIDRYIFKPVNKTLWNLRLMDKGISVGTTSPYCDKNFRTRALLELTQRVKPDCIIFEIGFKPSYEGLMKLRHRVSKIAGWWTMTTKWINVDEKEASLYDSFFFFNREFVPFARQMGFNAFYLPHAVNDYIFQEITSYFLDSEKKSWESDLVFVGGWHRPRQKVIEALASLDIDLHIYGPKWLKNNILNLSVLKYIKGKGLYGERLVNKYKSARIVLNINSWFGQKEYGINQRVFDVPACGGFLLTDYVREIEYFLEPGREIEVYGSIEELIDKVIFYLKNDSLREKIAKKGYEKAQTLPTWRDRAKEMVMILGLPSP